METIDRSVDLGEDALQSSSPQKDERGVVSLFERMLRSGLRPTTKRLCVASIVLKNDACHLSSKVIHRRLAEAGVRLSLATVYNTLNQFVSVGLLRRVVAGSGAVCFDARTADHCHFYLEDQRRLLDAPDGFIGNAPLSSLPDGYEVAHIDAVIHLTRCKGREHAGRTSVTGSFKSSQSQPDGETDGSLLV